MKQKYLYSIFLISCIIKAQSYTLNDCIQIALNGKKTVLSAGIDVNTAEKGLISSYSGLLPSLQFSTNIAQNKFPNRQSVDFNFESLTFDTTFTSSINNYSAGLSLNQMLYDGGRTINRVKQAKTNLNISKLNQRQIKTQVIQKVVQAYYDLLKAQKLSIVANKNLEMSIQQVDLVKKQFDIGLVKRTDLLKAQVAKGQAEVDAINKKINLENSRRILFNDMGLQDFGQDIIAIDQDWTMPKIPASTDVLKLLKSQNPTILISQNQISLSDLSYKLSKGLRLPLLNSTMNYSANGETSNQLLNALDDDWLLGINLSISLPIYTGNNLSMQQQQAKLSIQRSEYTYITLLNDFRVQAEIIRETLNNYAEIIPLNQAIVNSAEEDLKLVTERYSLGSATILEVLDAQVSLLSSNSNLINTVHDARIQEANLKAILGILDQDYNKKEE
tara:strand:- start:608 stop:1942 length:1335 start_codon:yes stop_codon:yes gene_type:complete